MDVWRWVNFTPKEIACRGTGELLLVHHAMDSLQELRNIVGKPLVINSAYRSKFHNKKVGGSPSSRHRSGDAFDIALKGHSKDALYLIAKQVGFTGFGLNYETFIHIDKGRERQW